tara:strand:- start:733 stop:1767 length:1035 start_codon:yes stop_codon:yes gene_type:complete
MSNDQKDVIDYESVLSKLTAKNLIKPTIILILVVVLSIIIFFTILLQTILSKLDSKSEYSIQVSTNIVEYLPNKSSIPSLNLSEFKILKSIRACPKLEVGKWYSNGELRLFSDSKVVIRLSSLNNIQLNIEPTKKNLKAAQLTSNKGRCVLREKLALDIKLTDTDPEFIMILVGNVTIGKELSFATSTTPSFLNSGTIEIKDRSFLFEDPIYLPTVSLSKGDTVLIPFDDENATTGLLIVELNKDSMHGVFNKKGGELRIIKPFSSNKGDPINISFFERLYSDNALAIALSISFIIIQVLLFMITTLIRLTYIPRGSYEERFNQADLNKQINNKNKDDTHEKNG